MKATPPLPPPGQLPSAPWSQRRILVTAGARAFHRYGAWLARLGWGRFVLLAALALVGAGVLQQVPPFNLTLHERLVEPDPPEPAESTKRGVRIQIGERGVIVQPAGRNADAAASAASASERAAELARRALEAADAAASAVEASVPPGASPERVRQITEDARREIRQALEDARGEAEEAARDAEEARRDAASVGAAAPGATRPRVERVTLGDPLPELAFFWIIASAILKLTYQGRVRAEAQAAKATEAAESEALRRQVVEARLAAMQAQVEPHFLFNTLAAIDHLIETDPPRASRMQKNLIALLRATMPALRDHAPGGLRDLGRELDVVRPYLDILQVRMEDRLSTRLDVPDGLRSAAFPPMMLQSLVENAVRHGLEPKPEGGVLAVRAEIVHGRLAVTVQDSGIGFGRGTTGGTGIGLANIRDRLKLLYGDRASLQVMEPPGGGTAVTITVPYAVNHDAPGAPPPDKTP